MQKPTILLLLALALLGCQPIRPAEPPASPDAAQDAPATIAAPTTTPEEDMTTETSPSNPVVEQAIADLAGRLTIDAAEIEVVSVENVTWSDGSLGCPQPGMFYTQALQDGMRVVLSAGGAEYHYHNAGNDTPFLCENPPAR
jgi:hypothetical protein